jgi:putative endonuclease
VYVLQNKEGAFYKGFTNNLERRFAEHTRGQTQTTRKMSGLKIVYIEKYITIEEASKREKYFKSAAGRRFLKKKLSPP